MQCPKYTQGQNEYDKRKQQSKHGNDNSNKCYNTTTTNKKTKQKTTTTKHKKTKQNKAISMMGGISPRSDVEMSKN